MKWQDFLDGADLLGTQQDERIKMANDALAKAQAKADETSEDNRRLYGLLDTNINQLYGKTANKYDDYLNNLENTESYDPGQFSFTGNVDDYYSKYANQRAKQAMNAIRESNDMFSSDYNDALAAKQQSLASEEWDKAYNRYMQDRSQAANEWNMNVNAGQQAYNNQYNKNRDLLGVAGDARNQIANSYGNYINNLANQNNVDLQNYANSVQQQAGNNLAAKTLFRKTLWVGEYNMIEQWIEIKHKRKKPNTIVAVSNMGRIKRVNGEIEVTKIRESLIRYNGKHCRLHRLIAILFIPKTEEDIKLGRDVVDHITHTPIGININDVRNLRWCTPKENANFPEALSNKQGKKRSSETCKKISDSRKGLTPWCKGLKGEEFKKHYKNGVKNQYTKKTK